MNTPPVITQLNRDTNGNQFTLVVSGETKTYTNDKAGKRQAIIDGLSAIETVAVGEAV